MLYPTYNSCSIKLTHVVSVINTSRYTLTLTVQIYSVLSSLYLSSPALIPLRSCRAIFKEILGVLLLLLLHDIPIRTRIVVARLSWPACGCFVTFSPGVSASRTAARVCFRGGEESTGPKRRNTCCQTCLRFSNGVAGKSFVAIPDPRRGQEGGGSPAGRNLKNAWRNDGAGSDEKRKLWGEETPRPRIGRLSIARRGHVGDANEHRI